MAEPISIQQLKDASEDAISLADFINEPENVMIPRRLASDINSLQYYLEYMKSFAQRSYETYDEMVANASNLSENVSVFVTNDSDTSKNGIYTYNGASFVRGEYQPENIAKDFVEAKLGGLQVFDGKVRAQDVVDNSLSQQIINKGLESIADLSTIENPNDGLRVYVKSYHAGMNTGGGFFTYDANKININDEGTIINGWVRNKHGDTVSVCDFGAVGNWNNNAKTGFDSTVAFQNALDYLKTQSSFRDGGVRIVYVPSGVYKVTHIIMRAENRWGVSIIGDGADTSVIYFDESITEEASILCETEYVTLQNLGLVGSINDTWTPSLDRAVGFLGRHKSRALDIDFKLLNCHVSKWGVFARIEGRGFVCNDNTVSATMTLLNIHVRNDANLPQREGGDANSLFSYGASMRHYNIRDTRTDGCSRLIHITKDVGELADKLANNINNIQVIGNDFQGVDCIVYFDEKSDENRFRIKNSIFSDNISTASFTYGAFRFDRVINSVISGNTFTPNNSLNIYEEQTPATSFMSRLITAVSIENVLVIGNVVTGIAGEVVRIFDLANSSVNGLKVVNNIFPEFASASGYQIVRTVFLCYDSTPTNDVEITNNTFSSSAKTGIFRLTDNNSVHRPKLILSGNSTKGFAFTDDRVLVTKQLIDGDADKTLRYLYTRGQDGYIEGYFWLSLNITESDITQNGSVKLEFKFDINAAADKLPVSGLYIGSLIAQYETISQGLVTGDSINLVMVKSSDTAAITVRDPLSTLSLSINSFEAGNYRAEGSFRFKPL